MKTIVLTLVMVMMLGLSIKAAEFNEAEMDEVLAYLQANQVDMSEMDEGEVVQENEEVEKQGAGIKILYAYYGLACTKGVLRKSVEVRSTAYAKSKCEGKQSCRGMVSNRYLSDPYGGCHKNFIVVASCKNGKEIISSYVTKEGKYFSLKCSGCSKK
ncbi:uncharacterized protein LOC135344549 [Halichondria panicea]|uniref:uncharacterized protein LOC135344549 n=1 Tax=Halichondria panicea TaxID=6063 RepID=UPI00312B6701